MTNVCPVCGYAELTEGTYGFCPSCGYDFDAMDAFFISYEAYRAEWVRRGMPWYLTRTNPPANWNPKAQLQNVVETTPPHFVFPENRRNGLGLSLVVTPALRARPALLTAFMRDILTLLRPFGVDHIDTDEPRRYRDSEGGLAALGRSIAEGAVGDMRFAGQRIFHTSGRVDLTSETAYRDATHVSLRFVDAGDELFRPPIAACIALIERWAGPLELAAAGITHGSCATHRDGSLYLSQREREHGRLWEWQAARRFVRGITWGTALGPDLCARLGGQARVLREAPVAVARPLANDGVWLQLSETPPAPIPVLEQYAAYLEPVRHWTLADITTPGSAENRDATPVVAPVPDPPPPAFPVIFLEGTRKRGDAALNLYLTEPPTSGQRQALAVAVREWDAMRRVPLSRQASETIFHALRPPRVLSGPAAVGSVFRWNAIFGHRDLSSEHHLRDLCFRLASVRDVQIERLVIGIETVG